MPHASGGEPLEVQVMEEHRHALAFWPAAARRDGGGPSHGDGWSQALSVLHVDTHSDLMEVEAEFSQDWKSWAPLLAETARELRREGGGRHPRADEHRQDDDDGGARRGDKRQLQRQLWHQTAVPKVKISNFITVAVWLGMVDRVVWVRSDFPSGEYGSPPLGDYRAQILLEQDWDVEPGDFVGSWLCFRMWSASGAGEQAAGEDADADGAGEPAAGEDAEFATCDPASDAAQLPSREFSLTVVTLRDAVDALSAGALTPEWLVHGKGIDASRRDWVLDVDLDAFASHDPSRKLFEEANLTKAFADRLAGYLDTNQQCQRDPGCGCLTAHARVHNMGSLHLDIIQNLAELPDNIAASPHGPATDAEKSAVVHAAFPPNCSLGEESGASVFGMAAGLDAEGRRAWRRAFETAIGGNFFDEDFMHSMLTDSPSANSVCPAEAWRQLRLFQQLASHLLSEGMASPRVVTLCRSIWDRYLPEELWPEVERSVLASLSEAHSPRGRLQVAYQEGLSRAPGPPPPGSPLGPVARAAAAEAAAADARVAAPAAEARDIGRGRVAEHSAGAPIGERHEL